ncbi:MAG: hypothetical protein A2288_00915 [Candidatus Moranbacteria bacterium RIFOXYA12_FULL_44_15]|nr:MAG: hypothetical protein A2288_00915 [Candidatus Moranbacteria bacterium RIFOXYA12_FULL_44_15]OGI36441.1 MAG: hypothetical protein A2259_00810 [Candidatus Moranbacteria bacterium RIFOXYA2_FULL_43_15]
MGKESEKGIEELIKKLEKDRKSRVILYFTGDKQPVEQFGTLIAPDVLPHFKEILEKIKHAKKISLVLNTNGGRLEAPWPLVNLIREYCDSFEVIIPEKALSAGTLIALGADKIVMLPYSYLSPIDPATEIFDDQKKQVKRIEIEDIIGYIDFAKDKIGIAEQSALAEVMKELVKEIGPTLLGSINRTHSLIRKLSLKMLYLHNGKLAEKQIKEITEHLTQKLYSHKHLINREEAKEIVGFGNIIEFGRGETKEIIDSIFLFFVELFELREEFNPLTVIGEGSKADYALTRAAICSADFKYYFNSQYKMVKIPDPAGNQQIRIDNYKNKWELIK